MKYQIRNMGKMWYIIEVGTGKTVGFDSVYRNAKLRAEAMEKRHG